MMLFYAPATLTHSALRMLAMRVGTPFASLQRRGLTRGLHLPAVIVAPTNYFKQLRFGLMKFRLISSGRGFCKTPVNTVSESASGNARE